MNEGSGSSRETAKEGKRCSRTLFLHPYFRFPPLLRAGLECHEWYGVVWGVTVLDLVARLYTLDFEGSSASLVERVLGTPSAIFKSQ